LSLLSFESILDSAVITSLDSFPASFRRHQTEQVVARRQEAKFEEHKAKMMLEIAAPFDYSQN